MTNTTAHVDTFARDNLPRAETLPEFLLDGFDYPPELNVGTELTDAMVAKGFGDHTALIGNGRRRTYKGQQCCNVFLCWSRVTIDAAGFGEDLRG